MKYKYNKNLDLFIRHSKTFGDCRVEQNRELDYFPETPYEINVKLCVCFFQVINAGIF